MKLTVKPTIAAVSVFAAVFVLGFFLLIAPELTPIGEDLARLSQYTNTTSVKVTKNPDTSLKTYQQQADLVNALMPSENELYDLSVQIEALAKTSKVALASLALNPANTTGQQTTSAQASAGAIPLPANVQQATISLSVQGEYEDIQVFVQGLTTLKRYIQIQNVTITKSTNQITGQVQAVTYYLPYDSAKK